jgi:prepilin-type N-terminal cleavage/methylation domain-containing protein
MITKNILPVSYKGFTMIELIVVLSIVVVMSTIVIFNYSGTRSKTVLLTTTYDIAGLFRSAEIGGRSAAQAALTSSTLSQNPAVGVYMETTGLDSAIQTFKIYSKRTSGSGFQVLDTVLDEITLQDPKIKTYVCSGSVDYSAKTCTRYSGATWIEFARLTPKPIIDPVYSGLLGGNAPVLLVQDTVDTKNAKFIIIERTGNIVVK